MTLFAEHEMIRNDGSRTHGLIDDQVMWFLQDYGAGQAGQTLLRSLYEIAQLDYVGTRMMPAMVFPMRGSMSLHIVTPRGEVYEDAIVALRNALVMVEDTVVIRNTIQGRTMPWEEDIPVAVKGEVRYLWMYQAFEIRNATDEFVSCFNIDHEISCRLTGEMADYYQSWLIMRRQVFHEKT